MHELVDETDIQLAGDIERSGSCTRGYLVPYVYLHSLNNKKIKKIEFGWVSL